MPLERTFAKVALDQARADHAAALLGRGAWKGYQEAATVGLAAQTDGSGND